MRVAWKLALSYAVGHPLRVLLTSLAMVASACMVVWVVSGYDALLSQFDEFASEYLGRYDLVVVPEPPGNRIMPPGWESETGIPAELIAALGQDPDVAALDPAVQSRVEVLSDASPPDSGSAGVSRPSGSARVSRPRRVDDRRSPPDSETSGPASGSVGRPATAQKPNGEAPRALIPDPSPAKRERGAGSGKGAKPPAGGPPRRGGPRGFFMSPRLVGTNALRPPYPMVRGEWIDPARPEAMEAALSSGSAEDLRVDVGDEVRVVSEAGKFTLKIVGIVEQVSPGGRSGGRRM